MRKTRMDELCEIVTDGTHDSPKLQEKGVPFIKGKHISGGIVDFSSCDFITQEDHEEACQRVKPQRGDILFSNIGSVGDTAVINDDREFSIKNVALFRANNNKVDSSYLYYLVLSPEFRSSVMNLRSGSAQPFISLKNLRGFEVSYFEELPIQRRIAGILSAYDELIENNQRRIKILEDMARALYREWFVHFRFPGHEDVPLVPSPLGDIPQGWECVTFAKAALFENGDRGKNYPSRNDFVDTGIPFINAGHLADGAIDFSGMNYILEEKFHQLSRGKIRKGDLLYCLRGSPGRTARTATLGCGAIASSLVIIRPSDHANEAFLYYTLSGEIGKRMATELDNGAAQPNVSVGSVQKYPLLLPPINLLDRFASSIESSWRQIETLRAQVTNLRDQRDLLLPRLLSGQIDVEALPS